MSNKPADYKRAMEELQKHPGKGDWQQQMVNVGQQEITALDNVKTSIDNLNSTMGQLGTHLNNLFGWPGGSSHSARAGGVKDSGAPFGVSNIALASIERGGISVRTRGGGSAQLSGAEVLALQGVSKKTGVPLGLLMSVEATESGGVNQYQQGKTPGTAGVGLFQFDFSTASNYEASKRDLNWAAQQLHRHLAANKFGATQLAMTPDVARLAAGHRLAALLANPRSGGDLKAVASAYNSGGFADTDYGVQVGGEAQKIQIELSGKLHPDGSATITPHRQTVDHHRLRPGPQRTQPKHPPPPPTVRRNGRP
jgi:hypothetical protein